MAAAAQSGAQPSFSYGTADSYADETAGYLRLSEQPVLRQISVLAALLEKLRFASSTAAKVRGEDNCPVVWL